MKYFYCGCKYKAHNPEGIKKLNEYLIKDNVEILGCCSKDYDKPNTEDTIIYQCPTCGLILNDSSKTNNITSIYEYLLDKKDYPFKDFNNKTYTMQDCWRMLENKQNMLAIRQILKKMNINVIEIKENYENTDFCGATLYREPSDRYKTLAYHSLVEKGQFNPQPIEIQKELMLKNGERYPTEEVLCYCTGCLEGINMSNHKGVHILDLVIEGLSS